MDSVYLISLIVGGFFVLLSIFGGGEHGGEADSDVDIDADVDADIDVDHELSLDHDHDIGADHDFGVGVGIVDLLSIRALFLFAAFFGLTGTALSLLGSEEPMTALFAVLTGLVVGLGGNYAIKRFAYEQVSSTVGSHDLTGRTAKVILPFEGEERGKILIEAKGQRVQLVARSIAEDSAEPYAPGDEVVVVRMNGRVAEVIKPD